MSAPRSRDVDRAVLRDVHAVDGDERPRRLGAGDEGGGRGHGADRVRRERERHERGSALQRLVERVDVEGRVVGPNVDPAHGRTRIACGQHPWAHVRVVIEPGDDDLVAGTDRVGERPRQVEQQRRRVRPEHDLPGVGADEIGAGASSRGHGRLEVLARGEHPVHVRDTVPVVTLDRVDHGVGHLGSARRVGEDHGAAVMGPREGREARSERGEVGRRRHARYLRRSRRRRQPGGRPVPDAPRAPTRGALGPKLAEGVRRSGSARHATRRR